MSGPARSPRQRALGQNFLVDQNILGVIGRLAELTADDVVLEVGGGAGVLSGYLAARVAALHVVELDERLEPRLRERLAPFPRAQLHMGDAVRMPLGDLAPAPGKLVANLPYGVAATVILRTVQDLPQILRWVAMVQREVGERLAAHVGDEAYGVPSVLSQLACEVRVLRAVPRTVFRPVPNVDSVLVGMRRTGVGVEPEVRRLVHDAFAHRRKALARSVVLSRGEVPDLRERLREALIELGHPADERAERLAPEEFRELARLIAAA